MISWLSALQKKPEIVHLLPACLKYMPSPSFAVGYVPMVVDTDVYVNKLGQMKRQCFIVCISAQVHCKMQW
jgi:hypothetical protein